MVYCPDPGSPGPRCLLLSGMRNAKCSVGALLRITYHPAQRLSRQKQGPDSAIAPVCGTIREVAEHREACPWDRPPKMTPLLGRPGASRAVSRYRSRIILRTSRRPSDCRT
jgi:hypothetical protein